MKTEEAVELLENLKVCRQAHTLFNIEKEAVDMAIEALKEMPVEEYRQRLMDVFHKTDHDELLTYVVQPKEEEFKSLEDILRQYKFEPRQRGEWIEQSDNYGDPYYECSVCEDAFITLEGTPKENHYNFCPNCGSDMRKKEGESE